MLRSRLISGLVQTEFRRRGANNLLKIRQFGDRLEIHN
jgi:hypothetical protein